MRGPRITPAGPGTATIQGTLLAPLNLSNDTTDLGVFVKGVGSTDFWDYECGLSQEIEQVLCHSFPVEAKVINRAPISFCYHVIRGRLLFVRDESVMVGFMTRVARTYLDMVPLRRKYMLEAMA